jgi:chromosome segregation ATPase
MKKNVLETLNKHPLATLVCIVGVAAYLIWTIGGIFADQTEITTLKQEIQELKENAAIEEARHEKERKDAEEIIRRQLLDIIEAQYRRDQAEARIQEKNQQLKARDKAIAGLEYAYDKLTQPGEKIANLKSQVAEWKGKFTLCQSIIAEKDEVIFTLKAEVVGWRASFREQVKIAERYKSDWLRQKSIAEKEAELIDAQGRTIKRLRFQLTVGKVVVGVGVAAAVLKLIGVYTP